jgi:hypothetical protein
VPRPSRITLIFAIAFALVLLGPPEVGHAQFGPNPDLKWQDILDIATPVVMLPAYWMLVRQPRWAPDFDQVELLLFLGLAAVWAEAQGMHLAANSIDNLVGQQGLPAPPIIHLFDEIVSHYLWLAAIVGLAGLAYVRQWRHPLQADREADVPPRRADLVVVAVAGLIYGLTFFIIVIEGQTGALGIPAAVVLILLPLLLSRRRLLWEPVSAFVLTGHLCAIVLFAAWWVYWGGRLPQFTEVGLF